MAFSSGRRIGDLDQNDTPAYHNRWQIRIEGHIPLRSGKTEDHFLEMKKKISGSGGGRAGLETVVLRSPICWWVFRLLPITPPPVQLPLLRLTDRRRQR
ncbi:hypothetical protein QLX08_001947 [Tetragonisca angustula]|uniref:Uncharacterized protein n=1 Tax=Tetragonisca angustula TaxID=166442 RepID=A0AAW1AGH4_9HYME